MSKKYVLAVETATNWGSLALFSEQNDKIDCYIGNTDNKMSAYIFDMIRDLIARNNIEINQISKIIVVNGPGSFTGLRVGWAAVKGLAKGLKIPYASVSLLDLLFEQLIEDKTPDCTFISIGGGKIALKKSKTGKVEILLNNDFFKLLNEFSDQIFVTIKGSNNLFQNEFVEPDCVFYASDNVSNLAVRCFNKGIVDINELNYFG